jgi:putative ABC transport system substrate-binding protein
MINRRSFIVGSVAALGASLAAEAQARGRLHRVGYLAAGSDANSYVGAFRKGLRALGYSEGRSIEIVYRWSEGKYELLPKLAAELVNLDVDVIVAVNAPAAQAVKQATKTIPIVITVLVDPVVAGLVGSLARPGGNITGLTFVAPDLVGKQLELLKAVVPTMSRVAVLGNPENPGTAAQMREAKSAAKILGLQLQPMEARSPSEVRTAFATITTSHAEGLLVLVDAMLGSQRDRIANLAAKGRLPVVSGLTRDAEAGSLLGYGANRVEVHHRVALYVDRILKGAKPGDMPIEQPTKFELVINLKTAKALGLTIPPSLLLRADQVIE